MPLHRRIPKRGFSNALFRKDYAIVNVSDLARLTDVDKAVRLDPVEMKKRGLIRKLGKDGVRILGDGKIERALTVAAHYFTPGAKEKIEKAGGTCEVIVQ